jgi:hypothetical protein
MRTNFSAGINTLRLEEERRRKEQRSRRSSQRQRLFRGRETFFAVEGGTLGIWL